MISGRYPNLGPEVLADAGVVVLDRVEGIDAIEDGTDGAGPRRGRVRRRGRRSPSAARSTGRSSQHEMAEARRGLATQLETLHPQQHRVPPPRAGPPAARARAAARWPPGSTDRPVVVVVPGHEHEAELAAISAFLREQQPGADRRRPRRRRPPRRRPQARHRRARRRARRRRPARRRRRCAPPATSWSGSTAAGARTPTSSSGSASARCTSSPPPPPRTSRCCSPTPATRRVIVGVGMHATLDEFLDRQRSGPRQHLPDPAQGRARPRRRPRRCRRCTPAGSGRGTCCLVLLAGLIARRPPPSPSPPWARSGPTSSPGSSPT